MNKWAYKKLPTYKTQNKIVLQTPTHSKKEFFFIKQLSNSL